MRLLVTPLRATVFLPTIRGSMVSEILRAKFTIRESPVKGSWPRMNAPKPYWGNPRIAE